MILRKPLIWPLALFLATTPVLAAGQDDDVEWNGLSHIGWQDRTPVVPLRKEAFRVRFQAYRSDLTGARVRQYVTGTPIRYFTAQVVAERGPYAIWEAQLDGRDADQVRYDIEVTDGADTDYLGADGVGEWFALGGPFVLDFTTLEHAPLGSTPTSAGTAFRVWAPHTSSAHVRGQFNGWGLSNALAKFGETFAGLVPNAATGQEYKYYFADTGTWQADAFARQIDMGEYDNTTVVDPLGYTWQSPPFSPPPFEEWVCYQLHVGSFAGLNDPYGAAPSVSRFVDVAARADHLAELGINVVYLNPILEVPGQSGGGYNPVNQTSLEEALGTPAECQAMVDALHARGIAVIVDVLYNHLDAWNNTLWAYTGPGAQHNLYFDTPPADTPWGPQLDLDEPRVRELCLDSAVMMLDEYRFDGFRVDAISALSWGPQPGASNTLLKDLNALADQRYLDKLMIAEVFGDDPWFTRPQGAGGLGFDAQYHTAFKDALRNAVFDAAFGDPDVGALAWAATRSGVEELQGTRVFNYFELHDDAWPLNGNQRAVRTIDPSWPHDSHYATGRTKLAQGLTLLAKGIPAILHGTEWLEDAGWSNKLDWSHKTTYAPIFDFYRELIALRTAEPALFADAEARSLHVNEGANVFSFERYRTGGDSFVVLANFSNSSWSGPSGYRIGLPRAGEWGVVLNSEASEYLGSGVGTSGVFQAEPSPYHGFAQSIALELPSHGFLLLRHDPFAADPTLAAAPAALSLAAGGTQNLTLQAGAAHASAPYLLLGTLSGTQPGLQLAPELNLPLNLDSYLLYTLTWPNTPPLSNSFGLLDASGRASASFSLPPGSPTALVGALLHHAFVLFEGPFFAAGAVSNPAALSLTP